MDKLINLKNVFITVSMAIYGMVSGFDSKIICLVSLMGIDWLLGGFIIPFGFKNSPKTNTGGASSTAGFKGIVKKICILLCVLAGYIIDYMVGIDIVYNSVIFGFACNEILSLIENMGLMDIPIPEAIREGVDLLKNKGEKHE